MHSLLPKTKSEEIHCGFFMLKIKNKSVDLYFYCYFVLLLNKKKHFEDFQRSRDPFLTRVVEN